MEQKKFEPGSVDVKKLDLITGVGEPVSLIKFARDVDIFESIFQPYIACEVIIADGVGLANKFPNMQEMKLQIEFSVPGHKSTNLTFGIIDRQGEETVGADKAKVYRLVGVSEEMDSHEAKGIIPEGVRGKNGSQKNYGELVGVILNDVVKTKKPITVEQTKGLREVHLDNSKPFKAIEWLRRMALSVKYQSHSYVFFENINGYHFVTMEKLFDEGKKRIGDKIFMYDGAVDLSVEGSNVRNILKKETLTIGKGLKQEIMDAFNAVVWFLDMETMQYKKIDKKQKDYNFVLLDDKGFNSSTMRSNQSEKARGTASFKIGKSEQFEEDAEKIAALQVFTPLLLSNIQRIFVYGDPALTVGDVIKCNFPDIDGLTGGKTEYSKTESGNYLITKLRHCIKLGGTPLYGQSLEIMKPGFGQGGVD